MRAANGGTPSAPASGYFVNDDRLSTATASVTAKPNAITPNGQETQAGRHPNVESQVAIVGWDDPASLTVKFPDGLMGSLAAVPATSRCTLADANAGNCPASARIGSMSGVGVSARDGSLTASGSIYLVRPEDVPSQYAAGVAVNLSADNPASQDLGNIRAVGYLGVRNELQPGTPLRTYDGGRNMFLTIPSVPNSTDAGTGTETRASARRFHITDATATIDGTVGSTSDPATSRPLITNPHYCGTQFPSGSWNRQDQKRFVGSVTGYAGSVISNVQAPYAVTCTTQAFAPTFDFAVKEVTDIDWTDFEAGVYKCDGQGVSRAARRSAEYAECHDRARRDSAAPVHCHRLCEYGEQQLDVWSFLCVPLGFCVRLHLIRARNRSEQYLHLLPAKFDSRIGEHRVANLLGCARRSHIWNQLRRRAVLRGLVRPERRSDEPTGSFVRLVHSFRCRCDRS